MPYVPPSLRKKKEEEKKKSQSAWRLKGTQSYSEWMKVKKDKQEREEREAQGRKQLLLARFPSLPSSKRELNNNSSTSSPHAQSQFPTLTTNYLKTATEPRKISQPTCKPSERYQGPTWSCNNITVFPVIFSPPKRTTITKTHIVPIESCTTTPGYIDPYEIDMMYDDLMQETQTSNEDSDIDCYDM